MPRRVRGDLLLFLAALAVRLGWLSEFSRLPFFEIPVSDSLFYAREASRVAGGEWLGEELTYPSSPLYPYLAAIFFLLKGRLAFWGIFSAQCLADALNAVLLRRAAGRLWGEAAGWLAGGGWAAYGLAVFYATDLMEASFSAFLATLGLVLILKPSERRAGGAGEGEPGRAKPSPLWWARHFGSGACLAMAALLRPQLMVTLPVIVVGLLLLSPRRLSHLAAGACATSMILVLGMSLARNFAISGEWILVSPYSGLNAYLGNHRGATGYLRVPPGLGLENNMRLRESAWIYPEAVTGRKLSEREVSEFWWARTLDEIGQAPLRWGRLMLVKLRLFWSSLEPPNHLDYYYFRGNSTWLKVAAFPFGLAAPLALAAMVLLATGRMRSGEAGLLAALLLIYSAATSLFFMADRFRLPVAGWVFMLAGAGFGRILTAFREHPGGAALLAAGIVALGIALHVPAGEHHGTRERILIAATLAGRGKTLQAESILRGVVADDPDSIAGRFNLARHLAATGRESEAIDELSHPGLEDAAFAPAHRLLGILLDRSGEDPEGARHHLERSLELAPYSPESAQVRQRLERLRGS